MFRADLYDDPNQVYNPQSGVLFMARIETIVTVIQNNDLMVSAPTVRIVAKIGARFQTAKQCSTTSQDCHSTEHDCSDCHPVHCTIGIHKIRSFDPNLLPK